MVRKKPAKAPAAIKQSESEALEYAESILNTLREPLLALDSDLRVIKVNRSFYETFKVTPAETLGQLVYDLGNKQWDIPKLRELLESILPQKSVFNDYEVEHDFATIGSRTMLLNARRVQGLLGEKQVILLAIEDVTLRKGIEGRLERTHLQELEATKIAAGEVGIFAESIFNIVREPLLALAPDLRVIKASRSLYETFKVTPAETLGQLIYDLGNRQWDIPKLHDLLESILPQTSFFNDYEVGHDFATIGSRTMLLNAREIKQDLGRPLFILLAIEDITLRKRLEQTLAREARFMGNLINAVGDPVFVKDDSFRFILANDALCNMLGMDREKIIGKTLGESLPKDQMDHFLDIDQMVLNSGQENLCEEPLTGKGGDILTIVTRKTRYVDEHGNRFIVGVIRDITERKQAEELLRSSEAQYRLLADHMKDTVWMMDMNLKTIYQSPSVQIVRGFTPQEIEEMPLEKHLTPKSLKIATDVFLTEMAMVAADPNYNFVRTLELEFYRKDGKSFWSENTFSIIRDENGMPQSILGEGRDITERKKAEEDLRESEAQYRLLAEHTTDVIRLLDMDLKTTYLSPSAEKLRGFTLQEMLEMPLEKQITPESLRAAYAVLSEEIPRVESDPGYNPIFTLDLEYYCKDGTTIWTESKFSLIRDENGKAMSILAEARNITERKKVEEKLLKSYESLKKTLNDAISTMVKIVELRDPYTAGHQQKVADLAIAIAGEMKFGDTQLDELRMAAVIHDIGKIYIPSDILSKPGKLGSIEMDLIKTHAQKGYTIVKGMELPGAVAETILQHHERLDGSGYPNGLKAEDTLMKAKILAVADVVEAMASHRPYRPALGIDRALEEISKNKGKLYDPGVVDACLVLFKSGRFEFKLV